VPAATRDFEAFAVGDAETFAKTITDADIVLFAGVSGDTYPLHLDAEYAKGTRFGARIAHGMLSASLLSTVNALLLGQPGGIYVEQSLRFLRPVFIGEAASALPHDRDQSKRQERHRRRSGSPKGLITQP